MRVTAAGALKACAAATAVCARKKDDSELEPFEDEEDCNECGGHEKSALCRYGSQDVLPYFTTTYRLRC